MRNRLGGGENLGLLDVGEDARAKALKGRQKRTMTALTAPGDLLLPSLADHTDGNIARRLVHGCVGETTSALSQLCSSLAGLIDIQKTFLLRASLFSSVKWGQCMIRFCLHLEGYRLSKRLIPHQLLQNIFPGLSSLLSWVFFKSRISPRLPNPGLRRHRT